MEKQKQYMEIFYAAMEYILNYGELNDEITTTCENNIKNIISHMNIQQSNESYNFIEKNKDRLIDIIYIRIKNSIESNRIIKIQIIQKNIENFLKALPQDEDNIIINPNITKQFDNTDKQLKEMSLEDLLIWKTKIEQSDATDEISRITNSRLLTAINYHIRIIQRETPTEDTITRK